MTRAVLLALLVARGSSAQDARARTIVVSPVGPVTTISAALNEARPGDRIAVRAGTYTEPTIVVRQSVSIAGEPGVILDGAGNRAIMLVTAPGVTIRDLTFRNTGASHIEDRAALTVREAGDCTITDNRFEETHFGIYLQKTSGCVVARNTIVGGSRRQTLGGNGIHVWQSDRVVVDGNRVRGHRDGIYFEFVTNGEVRGNTSERNQRYGLHFMFSDDCTYRGNAFLDNESGVAVMYTRRVQMLDNTFAGNRGAAAYGLLLKDISDSEIRGNTFTSNTNGLYLEGANRNVIAGNAFTSNGWALRLLANAERNEVTGNRFIGNSFDVSTNSRQNFSTFRGNYWDRYRGYDLDRDGYGDVPHAPVRLFALVVEQTPAAILLLRSTMVDLLDLAERVLPVLTPQTLLDEQPLMRVAERVPATAVAPADSARAPGTVR